MFSLTQVMEFYSSIFKMHLPAIVEIYNTLGEKIYQKKILNDTTEIDISKETKGMYFYQIISQNKNIASRKILIQQKNLGEYFESLINFGQEFWL